MRSVHYTPLLSAEKYRNLIIRQIFPDFIHYLEISEISLFELENQVIFMNNAQKTREVILALLKSKSITASQMLHDTSLNPSLLTDMQRKKSMPSADKLAKIADYLSVSSDYLLGIDTGKIKKEPPVSVTAQDAQKVYDKLVEIGFIKPGEKLTDSHLEILDDVLSPQAEFLRFKLDQIK